MSYKRDDRVRVVSSPYFAFELQRGAVGTVVVVGDGYVLVKMDNYRGPTGFSGNRGEGWAFDNYDVEPE